MELGRDNFYFNQTKGYFFSWQRGIGFKSGPHSCILETLKMVPSAIKARDTNSEGRVDALAHKQAQLFVMRS